MLIKRYVVEPRPQAATTGPRRAANGGWIYALGPLLVGLLLVARRQPLSRSGHMLLQCAIVLLVYGLLALWLQSNRVAQCAPKPPVKLKLIDLTYTLLADELAEQPTTALKVVTSPQVQQGIALSALPQRDSVALIARRN